MERPKHIELARITCGKTWDEEHQEYIPDTPVWGGDQFYAALSEDFLKLYDPRYVKVDGDYIDLNGLALHIVGRYPPPDDFILVERVE